MKGNAVIGQSGGPTSVINASLAGAVSAALKNPDIGTVYGMNYGIEGFMQEQLINLSAQKKEVLEGLKTTPSSALGSSRHKVRESDFPRILEVLKKFDIRYFFLIGGNDTMDTIHRVEKYCRAQNYELYGVGIPKTVDNDLFGTHHTPGFMSAARYNILSVKQSGVLARDMQKVDKFVIYQTVGRDAGWLAAATALAKEKESDAPHLIYMPETKFNKAEFIADAKACIEKYGFCSIVCGEGIKYADGTPVSASQTKDKFNNIEFGAMGGTSVAIQLHRMLREETGFRGEFQITESLIMCAADRAVQRDIDEAFACGEEAVRLASEGKSGVMVTIEPDSADPSRSVYGTAPLNEVAVNAKEMPRDFINERGNFVTEKFYTYMKPLMTDLPHYVELDKNL